MLLLEKGEIHPGKENTSRIQQITKHTFNGRWEENYPLMCFVVVIEISFTQQMFTEHLEEISKAKLGTWNVPSQNVFFVIKIILFFKILSPEETLSFPKLPKRILDIRSVSGRTITIGNHSTKWTRCGRQGSKACLMKVLSVTHCL